MTDKVQKIREEVERLRNINVVSEYKEYAQYELDVKCGYEEALDDIEAFINSLPEEPVSEDLEDAAYKFVMNNFGNPKEPLYKFDQRCFKVGAKWQKEQMMAKAVDATLLNGNLIKQKHTTHPLHVGDKVKVIVIKED